MSGQFRVLIATERPVEGLEVAAAIAKRWGRIDAKFAQDGAEAVARLHERKPHLLVASVDLPRVDGIALTGTLRRSARLGALPILLILDGSATYRIRDALAARPSAILVRPYDREKLLEHVVQALSAKADVPSTSPALTA
jgi:CheY-like chemotaxis protein